jgi:hypothetical protein
MFLNMNIHFYLVMKLHNINKVRCTLCKSVSHGGRKDIEKHIHANKHKASQKKKEHSLSILLLTINGLYLNSNSEAM